MAALEILNNMIKPDTIDQELAQQMIDNAVIFVSLYDTIPVARIELAKALYAAHLLAKQGVLGNIASQSFDGGSVSLQAINTGDKEGMTTWLQEFLKLVPDAYSPQVIL